MRLDVKKRLHLSGNSKVVPKGDGWRYSSGIKDCRWKGLDMANVTNPSQNSAPDYYLLLGSREGDNRDESVEQ